MLSNLCSNPSPLQTSTICVLYTSSPPLPLSWPSPHCPPKSLWSSSSPPPLSSSQPPPPPSSSPHHHHHHHHHHHNHITTILTTATSLSPPPPSSKPNDKKRKIPVTCFMLGMSLNLVRTTANTGRLKSSPPSSPPSALWASMR